MCRDVRLGCERARSRQGTRYKIQLSDDDWYDYSVQPGVGRNVTSTVLATGSERDREVESRVIRRVGSKTGDRGDASSTNHAGFISLSANGHEFPDHQERFKVWALCRRARAKAWAGESSKQQAAVGRFAGWLVPVVCFELCTASSLSTIWLCIIVPGSTRVPVPRWGDYAMKKERQSL